jgi:hypothetical protein
MKMIDCHIYQNCCFWSECVSSFSQPLFELTTNSKKINLFWKKTLIPKQQQKNIYDEEEEWLI